MHYLVVSFTHKNTDISVREKLSFSSDEKKLNFLEILGKCEQINEVIILSTCNRVEIIASVNEPNRAIEYIFEHLAKISNISKSCFFVIGFTIYFKSPNSVELSIKSVSV